MAKASQVWGIDIGQCGLKALRCSLDGETIVADAFDYIEYPKILSQPESDPEELVREALTQFLSRNDVRRCRIAISVPGQSGLAKFFKPPPVDVKRIPDIVRYEARQQIPFPLEEVVWDFQKMVGGQEVDGFAIDAEVGLFAMKREQVYRSLEPFRKQEIEVDIIQLAPLSIYNFVAYDLLVDLPDPELFDPDDPPESIVVMSMGTDATDLVITNGFRVWQRSIPLGGNHFTKQLTKDMKLTFAKAEHLKRNARQAEDPKSVFQAMRPVFNDVVTEVQRSIGYFQGIDRKAKIRGVVLLGNTVKLPGLQQYIAKNLGYEVINFESFNRLTGTAVTAAPAFQDNSVAFGVCYGLCIQGLNQALLGSNLLPPEIKTQRMVRAKKPWAIASVGALMLAFAFNFVFNYSVWSKVREERDTGGKTWKQAENDVQQALTLSTTYNNKHKDKVAKLKFLEQLGDEVVGAADRRLLWLEMLKTIDQALPWTEGRNPQTYYSFSELPIDKREELHIEAIESQHFADLSSWYLSSRVARRHFELLQHFERVGIALPAEPAEDEEQDTFASEEEDRLGGLEKVPGWVVEISGFHYYNTEQGSIGADHVRNTLLKNLEMGSVVLPIDEAGTTAEFTMKEMGIQYPILSFDGGELTMESVENPDYRVGEPISENENPVNFQVLKYAFKVQFCWQPKLLTQRMAAKEAAKKQDQEQPDAE